MPFPSTPLPVKVYIAPGGNPADPTSWQWVDITGDTLVRAGIGIEIGSADEATQVDASKANLTINNENGHYTTRNPMGRHYPNLRRNTPLRVSLAPIFDSMKRPGTTTLGTADSGHPWTYLNGMTDANLSMSAAGAEIITNNVNTSRRAHFAGADLLDVDAAITVQFPVGIPAGNTAAQQFFGLMVRGRLISGVWRYYLGALYQFDNYNVWFGILTIQPNGTGIWTFGGYIPHDANAKYRLRIRAEGDLITCKGWNLAGDEPDGWNVSLRDTLWTRPGAIGFRAWASTDFPDPNGRVIVSDLAVEGDLMVGTVPSWPPRWHKTGRDPHAPITAAGVLRRLSQGKTPQRSPLVRQMLASNPKIFIPLEDGDESEFFAASVVPYSPPAETWGVTFGQDNSLPGAEQAATLSAATMITARAPAHTAPNGWSYIFIAKSIALPPEEFELCRVEVNGGTIRTWVWSLSSTVWYCRGLDADGNLLTSKAIAIGDATPLKWTAYQLRLVQTGTSVTWECKLYTLHNPSFTTFYFLPQYTGTLGATYTGTAGTVARVRFTGATGWINGNLSMIHYAPTPDVSFFTFEFVNAVWGYQGESAAARIKRLCGEQKIPVFIEPGDSEALGRQKRDTFVNLVRAAAAADMGHLRELAGGLAYRPRGARYNQPVDVALDFRMWTGDGDIAEAPEPTDDDQLVRNDWTVGRDGGSTARAVDEDHVEAEGTYDDSVTLNLPDDTRLGSHANWRLALGTNDEMRWPRIVLDVAARPELLFPVMCLRRGSRITIANPPAEVLGAEVDLIVEGYTIDIGPFSMLVTLNCSPASPWQVGAIGTARVDSDNSTLGVALTATSTDLRINSGPDHWTQNPASFPFDLDVAGERVRALGPGAVRAAYQLAGTVEGWTVQDASGALTWSTTQVKRGTGSLRFVPAGTVATVGILGPAFPITVGATYSMAAWVYCTAAVADLRLTLVYQDAAGAYLGEHGFSGAALAIPEDTWTHCVVAFPAIPAGAVTGRLRVRIGGTPPATTIAYVSHPMLFETATVATGSPYRMTIVRTLNGVTKAHSVGAPVRLWRSARGRLAL